jgi:hypothetical protein
MILPRFRVLCPSHILCYLFMVRRLACRDYRAPCVTSSLLRSKATRVKLIKLPIGSIRTNLLGLHLYKRHPNGSEKVSKQEYKGRVNEAQMNETLS